MTTLQHFPVMSFDDPRHVGQGILNRTTNVNGVGHMGWPRGNMVS